jgi:hypothetical protein
VRPLPPHGGVKRIPPTYAGTLESLHRYRLDVVKLQAKQDFTRTFPLEPLVPPIQISPDAPARFQIQFIGNPETPTLYSIHLRLVFARTGSVDLPIVEFSL